MDELSRIERLYGSVSEYNRVREEEEFPDWDDYEEEDNEEDESEEIDTPEAIRTGRFSCTEPNQSQVPQSLPHDWIREFDYLEEI